MHGSPGVVGLAATNHEIRTNLVNAATDIAVVVAGHFHEKQSYSWLEEQAVSTAQTAHQEGTSQIGTLRIEASLEHAEVSVDGGFVGTAPLEVKLKAGSHRVAVSKRGFQDWTREVSVIEGGKQALWADLEPVPASGQQNDDNRE